MNRIHYIYQTTNLLNGKKYIGQRLVPEAMTLENDSYLGSGTLLLRSVKKHGKENFKKEILEICYSREDADRLEAFYFDKFQVLENKDIYYNRGLAGQYWRQEGHSEYMSKKMKKYYSDPENVKKCTAGRMNITIEEYDRLGRINDNEKKLRSINDKIKKLKKERYKYYRELTKDLRWEFYTEKRRVTHKEIWKTKKHDPEFLDAVNKGKEENGWYKHKSIIYDELKKLDLRLKDTSVMIPVRNYMSSHFRTKTTLELNIKKICELLKTNDNIIISLSELTKESKIKYSHLYN